MHRGGALLTLLGYTCPYLADDRHCLFRAFSRIATALDHKFDAADAREVGAAGWTDDAWESIVALFGPEGDEPRSAVWEWMEGACGPNLRGPRSIVRAYQRGKQRGEGCWQRGGS